LGTENRGNYEYVVTLSLEEFPKKVIRPYLERGLIDHAVPA